MVRSVVGSAVVVAAMMLGLAGAAGAEGTEQSFKSLVQHGFKVVATSTISAADAKADNAIIVVTMAHDQSVAVCTFSAGTWEYMSDVLETGDKSCEVRTYNPQ